MTANETKPHGDNLIRRTHAQQFNDSRHMDDAVLNTTWEHKQIICTYPCRKPQTFIYLLTLLGMAMVLIR